jgi:hypothetical protein
MELLIIAVLAVALNVACALWAFDSRDLPHGGLR